MFGGSACGGLFHSGGPLFKTPARALFFFFFLFFFRHPQKTRFWPPSAGPGTNGLPGARSCWKKGSTSTSRGATGTLRPVMVHVEVLYRRHAALWLEVARSVWRSRYMKAFRSYGILDRDIVFVCLSSAIRAPWAFGPFSPGERDDPGRPDWVEPPPLASSQQQPCR